MPEVDNIYTLRHSVIAVGNMQLLLLALVEWFSIFSYVHWYGALFFLCYLFDLLGLLVSSFGIFFLHLAL